MITIGAAISPAMYAWFTFANTFANRSTIAYINPYIAANEASATSASVLLRAALLHG